MSRIKAQTINLFAEFINEQTTDINKELMKNIN